MRRKKHRGNFIGRLACLGLFFALPSLAAAQHPLDEKSRYESDLENKLNEAVFKIIGPNKAKVLIQAEMDFSRTEKVSVEGPAGSLGPSNFHWAGIGQTASEKKSGPQLLPGFPVPSSAKGGEAPAAPEARSYATQLSYPASFVKRLTVTLILNKNLPSAEAENIRLFVYNILNLDSKRGDAIITVRTPFASFWTTVWSTPEAVSIVFKYGLLSLAVIVAMLAIMIAILKFSGSISSMAKTQQISMEFGKQADGAAAADGEAVPRAGLEFKKEQEEYSQPAAEGMEEVVFRVRPDQVPVLVHMMTKEDPANVALIAAHLPLDIRGAFLKALPPEISSEVIAHLAEFRFVKPDMIIALKEELERRFSGAVGGMDKVLQALDKISLKAKREMLLRLEEKHPEIARKVRAKVILFEDLFRLEPRDLSVLVSAVKTEDWSAVLSRMDEDFKGRLKSQMAEKTWQIVEQTFKYSVPSEEKSEKAIEEIVNAALTLIKEGRIASPLSAAQALLPDKAEK
ncbi:MAG: hypothetical protein A2X28_03190 [Elusimicrobia bacterium GWA2_56_46]|nr:MAG: hypothetical protein A2X28_03190 [Elusimicrobia bacterium GWA2_56_46]OGR54052.1 MAG: hypothetical protein A2X39_06545 [Elusimicrobia bacterium GWC2_56_31]HBB67928.1 hypothetical protein [Elusimicrobiota bacterium]HBW21744.1 hypothetical protein [Elusimicrobiota bacterium]